LFPPPPGGGGNNSPPPLRREIFSSSPKRVFFLTKGSPRRPKEFFKIWGIPPQFEGRPWGNLEGDILERGLSSFPPYFGAPLKRGFKSPLDYFLP